MQSRAILIGASVYALLLVCWQSLVVTRLQPATLHVEADTSKIEWYAGFGPFLRRGELQAPEPLFLGDSRVNDGIVLEELRALGWDRTSILWGASARLTKLLAIARELSARRLVVCLSMRSLEGPRGDPLAIALMGEAPPLITEDLDARLDAWQASQVEFLISMGFQREQADLVLARMVRMHREQVLSDAPTTAGLDRRLGRSLANSLGRYVRRVATGTWEASWFPTIDATSSNEIYRQGIQLEAVGAREITRNTVVSLIRDLVEDGFAIVCLRMPVAAELRAIEESVFSQQQYADLASDAGVPFLDYSRAGFRTRDGSHLLAEDARRFSRMLAADLRQSFK